MLARAAPVTARELLDALVSTVREADPAELPAIVGRLAEADAIARARMMTPPPAPAPPSTPEHWITAAEAARIAGVSVDRLYVWARGQRWASRPSRRCLRIDERGFRRWLASRQ